MNKEKDFNDAHPELLEGEMFLTNCLIDSDVYHEIRWKTKRRGRQAYAMDGTPLHLNKPIFVQRTEWKDGIRRVKE